MNSDVPRTMTSGLTLNSAEVSGIAALKTDDENVTTRVSHAAVMVMRNLRERGL